MGEKRQSQMNMNTVYNYMFGPLRILS